MMFGGVGRRLTQMDADGLDLFGVIGGDAD